MFISQIARFLFFYVGLCHHVCIADLKNSIKIIPNKTKIKTDEFSLVALTSGTEKGNDKPCHIKVWFNNSELKIIIYKNKTAFIIKEDPTILRLNAVKGVSTIYDYNNVCSMNDIIFSKLNKVLTKLVIIRSLLIVFIRQNLRTLDSN